MANPDRQSKPDIARSEQGVLNSSFDEVYRVLAVALLGEYNNALYRLKVDADGNLKTSGIDKPTDAYGIQAVAETATYKYFYYEDATPNYYILRKTLATGVFAYAKGTGTYTAVYGGPTSDPSPAQTFGTYGSTF